MGLTAVIAANFTADPILRPLRSWLSRLELPCRVELAPRDQIGQQLLDPVGMINHPPVGCVVVLLRGEALCRDGDSLRDRVDLLVDAMSRSPALAGGTRCLVVATPPSLAWPASLQSEMERRLAAAVEHLPVSLLTSSELARLHPVEEPYDRDGDRLADVPYTRMQFDALAAVVARHLRALLRPPRKVVAVDCDGVLWTGSCAEDGPHGVLLEDANLRLQRFLVRQAELGTMLCLCSKNAEADVLAVLDERSDMVLGTEHLAASRVNWKRKSTNLADLAAELGVGLGDVVFIDDSPVECAEVESGCPEVLTLQFPGLRALEFCDRLWALDRAYVTAEDQSRTRSRLLARSRDAARREHASYADFIRSLDVRVDVRPMTDRDADRMAQLSVRTNQFNATRVRRTPGEMRGLLDRTGWRCLTVRVTDRFEDYGLVGGVILDVSVAGRVWVESLFLSCRTLGRGVEHRILAWVGEMALREGAGAILLPVVPTSRNEPVQRFAAALPGAEVVAEAGRLVVHVSAAAAATIAVEVEPEPAGVELPAVVTELPPAPARENAVLREIAATGGAVGGPLQVAAAPPAADLIEPALRRMWSDLLRIADFGRHDSFFELGGTSLTAFSLLNRIRDELHVDLDPDLLFETSLTVDELTGAVRARLR